MRTMHGRHVIIKYEIKLTMTIMKSSKTAGPNEISIEILVSLNNKWIDSFYRRDK